jgi:hypothetical protein
VLVREERGAGCAGDGVWQSVPFCLVCCRISCCSPQLTAAAAACECPCPHHAAVVSHMAQGFMHWHGGLVSWLKGCP